MLGHLYHLLDPLSLVYHLLPFFKKNNYFFDFLFRNIWKVQTDGPWGPWRPRAPVSPRWPGSPYRPLEPLSPGRPSKPLKPGSPLSPLSPFVLLNYVFIKIQLILLKKFKNTSCKIRYHLSYQEGQHNHLCLVNQVSLTNLVLLFGLIWKKNYLNKY